MARSRKNKQPTWGPKTVKSTIAGMPTMIRFVPTMGGGEFYFRSDSTGYRINVGLAASWEKVVGTIIHETLELAMAVFRYRYEVVDKPYSRSTEHLFFLTHEEFTRACDYAGDLIAVLLPKASKAYRSYHANKRRKT